MTIIVSKQSAGLFESCIVHVSVGLTGHCMLQQGVLQHCPNVYSFKVLSSWYIDLLAFTTGS